MKFMNILSSPFGDICVLQSQIPRFEPDDGRRLKRFRHMLIEDWKKDAVFDVNGVRVPVHRDVLADSSAVLAVFGDVIPITGSSVDTVRHFTRYLYGFNVFEDDNLSIDEPLELAKLFIQFQIGEATAKAARYCLQKCTPAHLNKLCQVLGTAKEIQPELAQKIVDYLYCLDHSLIDKSILHLVVTSPQLPDLQKLIVIGKWIKLNSNNDLMKRLFETVDVENAGQLVKDMEQRLIRNDRMIDLQGKLEKEGSTKKILLQNKKHEDERISSINAMSKKEEKEIFKVQSPGQGKSGNLYNMRNSIEKCQTIEAKPRTSAIERKNKGRELLKNESTMTSHRILLNKHLSEIEVKTNEGNSIINVTMAKDPESQETSEKLSLHSDGGFDRTIEDIGLEKLYPKTAVKRRECDNKGKGFDGFIAPDLILPDSRRTESACLDAPSWFSDYVSELQQEWVHLPNGQTETTLLHQVHAIIELARMTQRALAIEASIPEWKLPKYLLGRFKGNLQNIEEKLAIFVRKFLVQNARKIPESVLNIGTDAI